jgi:hypothetical protein
MTRRSEVRCRCWLKIDPEHERDKQNAEWGGPSWDADTGVELDLHTVYSFTRELNVRASKDRIKEAGLDYSVHRAIRVLTIFRGAAAVLSNCIWTVKRVKGSFTYIRRIIKYRCSIKISIRKLLNHYLSCIWIMYILWTRMPDPGLIDPYILTATVLVSLVCVFDRKYVLTKQSENRSPGLPQSCSKNSLGVLE